MPKKILLIESDSAFAAATSESLEASGFDVRVAGDGKAGLDLAREWGPAAVVLSVELPGMSGYLVCQKLKKDDALRAIPLVLTSAEATEETFEKHRTLKARADEYLLKPYVPAALLEKLGSLIGLPEGAGEAEEIVSLDEEMGLEALTDDPESDLPALELEALPDEAAGGAHDDDLALLDHAFDDIAIPTPERPGDALDLALGDDRVPGALELTAAWDTSGRDPLGAPARSAVELGLGGGAGDEIAQASLRAQVEALEARAQSAEDQLAGAREEASHAEERARSAEEALADLRAELAAAEGRAAQAAAEAEQARAEARRSAAEVAAAAASAGRVEELEHELDALRTDLVVAQGEAEGAREEIEKRTAELRRRVSELEAANSKNEERVLKAYQKIKGDEKVKEKVRKALAIAAQLMDDGPIAEPPGDKARAAPPPLASRD